MYCGEMFKVHTLGQSCKVMYPYSWNADISLEKSVTCQRMPLCQAIMSHVKFKYNQILTEPLKIMEMINYKTETWLMSYQFYYRQSNLLPSMLSDAVDVTELWVWTLTTLCTVSVLKSGSGLSSSVTGIVRLSSRLCNSLSSCVKRSFSCSFCNSTSYRQQ